MTRRDSAYLDYCKFGENLLRDKRTDCYDFSWEAFLDENGSFYDFEVGDCVMLMPFANHKSDTLEGIVNDLVMYDHQRVYVQFSLSSEWFDQSELQLVKLSGLS